MHTPEQIDEKLNSGMDEDLLAKELADELYDSILDTLNKALEVSGAYKHPGVAIPALAMLCSTVIEQTLPKDKWLEGIDLLHAIVWSALETADSKQPTTEPTDGQS
jgi:hypothetical protein